MPDAAYVARATYGAWRLARLDPGGMGLFDLTVEGFWRSFFAAVVVAPFYFITVVIRFGTEAETGLEAGVVAYLMVKLAAYGVGWVLYPIVMIGVARLMSLSERYVPFIIAYNWSGVIQMAALFPLAMLEAGGIANEGFFGVLAMVVTGAVLFYQWFVARVALATTGLTAAAMVMLDLALAILVDRLALATL